MAHKDHQSRPGPKTEGRKGDLVPGSLASLDTTLPPTPLKKLLAADGASVYIYSHDQTLVETVQEAGGEQYPVHLVTEWPELLSVVDSGLCNIVLLDADTLSSRLEKLIVDLRGVQPSLVILLAAPRDAAQTHIGLLSDRSIHRLLIKPAAIGITRLLLESAVSRFLQLRERGQDSLEARIENLRRRPLEAPKAQWPTWLFAVALVSLLVAAVLVGGIVRLDFGGGSSARPGRTAPAVADVATSPVTADTVAVVSEPVVALDAQPVATAAEPEPEAGPGLAPEPDAEPEPLARAADAVAEQATPESPTADPGVDAPALDAVAAEPPAPFAAELERAEAAFAAGEIVRPIGASALDLFAAIVAAAPDHAVANARLETILGTLYGEAEAAMLDGDVATAGTALAHVRRARPESGRLMFLENQLARTREAQAQAAAARAAAAARPSEFESLLGIATARLRSDQIVAPAGDSAVVYLERAAELSPDDARLSEVRVELASRAVDRARLVLNEGDLDAATALADAAFRFGADSEALALLELDLVAARDAVANRERARRLELGRERLARGQLVAPAGDSAFDHVSAVRAERPDFPGLESLWAALTSALATDARESIDAGLWSDAEQTIAALESGGAESGLVDELNQALVVTRRQAAFLRDATPASELSLLVNTPPSYPSNALRRELEGWVDLEYVVGTDGFTSDIRVVQSEPAGVFDEAALEAVAGYVYAPFTLDGQRYERRVALRIRFTLQ